MDAGCDGLFRRLVAVGDSLSQGAQNVGVSERSQPFSVAALLAKQAGCQFRLPLLAEPGFPPHVDRLSDVFRARLTHRHLMLGQRLDPGAEIDNFAVAGSRLQDVVGLSCNRLGTHCRTYAVARLTRLTLNPLERPDWEQRSALDWAIAANPSAVLFWCGCNDVLEGIFYPRYGFTPVATFRRFWHLAVGRLLNETSAVVIVPTLPAVARAPLLWAWMRRHPNLRRRLQRRLQAFNEVLRQTDGRRGRICVLETETPFEHFVREGLPVKAYELPFEVPTGRLTYAPLRGRPGRITAGGLASYDGLHPTRTGYALLVNTLIELLNRRLGTTLPVIDLVATAREDPLLLRPDGYRWAILRAYCDAYYGPGVWRLAHQPGDGPAA